MGKPLRSSRALKSRASDSPGRSSWAEVERTALRLIGTGIGILPGIGGSTAGILSWMTAKKTSKHPEKYGTGIMDGVVASETSNNAVIGGALIPLLTLGIPGDGVTAMLLGAFMIHGLTPGPCSLWSPQTSSTPSSLPAFCQRGHAGA